MGLDDVAAATVRAVSPENVTGTFNIAGQYPFTRADCLALHRDAAAVITERAPDIAAAFHDRGWALPQQIDLIYDSSAAGNAFGYRPVRGVLALSASAGANLGTVIR